MLKTLLDWKFHILLLTIKLSLCLQRVNKQEDAMYLRIYTKNATDKYNEWNVSVAICECVFVFVWVERKYRDVCHTLLEKNQKGPFLALLISSLAGERERDANTTSELTFLQFGWWWVNLGCKFRHCYVYPWWKNPSMSKKVLDFEKWEICAALLITNCLSGKTAPSISKTWYLAS